MYPLIFSHIIEDADEPLKGRPRTVRLQKTDMTIVTDHDARGRVTDRRVYRPDGTLSFHESFQYETDAPVQTRRDSEGRVIEAVSADKAIHMQVEYRAGQPDAHVTFGAARDIHIVVGPEGTRLTYRDSAGHEYELPRAATRTLIQATDAQGNWTRKITMERDPATGDDVVVASMDQAITYYSE